MADFGGRFCMSEYFGGELFGGELRGRATGVSCGGRRPYKIVAHQNLALIQKFSSIQNRRPLKFACRPYKIVAPPKLSVAK